MPLDRRHFLRRASGFASAALLTPSLAPLARVAERLSRGGADPRALRAGLGDGGYGPLVEAGPDFLLPEGFAYWRFGDEGAPMTWGGPTPGRHDGMAAFPGPDGLIRLIRNHEEITPAERARPFGDPERAYDPRGPGGTTTLDVRADEGGVELVRSFPSLVGTHTNCAGGPTPWGSWLSCEETTRGPGSGYQRPHGYVFEVPADADSEVEPVPLPALGRFVHEAVAVDPDSWTVYLTEDFRWHPDPARGQRGSGFYRFQPERRGELREGGRLQALMVADHPGFHTVSGQIPGLALPVAWVDIPDPDPADAEADPGAVFAQAWAWGAARFQRLEGAWWGDGGVFFHSTSGGDARLGQVWHFRPVGEGGELTLVFESPGGEVLLNPDNVTVSPRGGVVICEDSGSRPYLRGLTPDGRIFDLARNIANDIELCGACFSPDGATLFVNMQGRDYLGVLGATFAIRGPWDRGAL